MNRPDPALVFIDPLDDFDPDAFDRDCPACGAPLGRDGDYLYCTDDDCRYVDI